MEEVPVTMPDLGGRRVLITGAAQRLGAVIARAFAECGAAVVVHCFRSKDDAEKLDFYTKQAEKLHMSAGAGLHVIMNQNFNINFEFGKCFDPNDGTGLGINIGLNYIF